MRGKFKRDIRDLQDTPVQFLGWEIPWRRVGLSTLVFMSFPGGSDGKESTFNVGDLGSVPGLGRSPGGGHGKALQYSWVSLVSQMVKNPTAIQ